MQVTQTKNPDTIYQLYLAKNNIWKNMKNINNYEDP